jgi:hypothetical protein
VPSSKISLKQQEFNDAMKKYHKIPFYQNTYKLISIINITLQIILVPILFSLSISYILIIPILFVAYFLTDFINGLVHLYMDHNDNYSSFLGVFIASFHLHHKTPEYKNNNIFAIYFNESGMKFWLVIYLLGVLILAILGINHILLAILILVGILSSFAEVSHYLCHNSKSKSVKFFQGIGIILSMKHHKNHHNEDNNSYAFLNGMSDFIIDKIAHTFYSGYKNNSDKHYEHYQGEDTSNRTI